MLNLAVLLFALAALGGVAMLYIHFKKNRNPPGVLAALHGLLAATGLVVLLWVVLATEAGGKLALALGLFAVAALGGFFLVSYHLRDQRLPSKFVVIHAAVAVVAFLILLSAVVVV